MKQKCDDCDHEWNYTGADKYVKCPNCHNNWAMSDEELYEHVMRSRPDLQPEDLTIPTPDGRQVVAPEVARQISDLVMKCSDGQVSEDREVSVGVLTYTMGEMVEAYKQSAEKYRVENARSAVVKYLPDPKGGDEV